MNLYISNKENNSVIINNDLLSSFSSFFILFREGLVLRYLHLCIKNVLNNSKILITKSKLRFTAKIPNVSVFSVSGDSSVLLDCSQLCMSFQKNFTDSQWKNTCSKLSQNTQLFTSKLNLSLKSWGLRSWKTSIIWKSHRLRSSL